QWVAHYPMRFGGGGLQNLLAAELYADAPADIDRQAIRTFDLRQQPSLPAGGEMPWEQPWISTTLFPHDRNLPIDAADLFPYRLLIKRDKTDGIQQIFLRHVVLRRNLTDHENSRAQQSRNNSERTEQCLDGRSIAL